jgi:thymidylate synthase ThyX
MKGILSDLPTVTLTKWFSTPLDNAVATARTCYSSKIIFDRDVSKDDNARALRDKIAHSTYAAGHHTTLQHAHFQFALAHVSRHALWSFFHAHAFYNSEQVSQRYVAVKDERFMQPDLGSLSLNNRFRQAILRQAEAYHKLNQLLQPVCEELYFEIYRGRRKNRDDPRWQNAIKKRVQEVSRYVLPIGTHAHLYHTISGLTLHRYNRLAQSFDCPYEQKLIINLMVNEVKKIDPDFFKNIEDTISLEKTLEYEIFTKLSLTSIDSNNAHAYAQDFDKNLNNKTAKLISFTANPEHIIGQALRQVLYVSQDKLSDQEAVKFLLSPKHNSYQGESLNLGSLSKLTRVLDLVHFSFIKKISHAADSQAQRHRMIPGSRALFSRTINLEEADYITPELFAHDKAQEAKRLYDQIHMQTLEDARWLYKNGASPESLQYIFTNAYPIRYTDSGTLLDHLHKWTTRLCYNAQEEIWRCTMDEVQAVKLNAPLIGQFLLPPCGLRYASGHTPICPEGDRFCGVAVWKQDISEYRRLL